MVTDDGKRVAPPYLDIEEEDSSSDIENADRKQWKKIWKPVQSLWESFEKSDY